MNSTKQKFLKVHKSFSPATNPMGVEVQKSEVSPKGRNSKELIDSLMFLALGAVAIWAFYSALFALML